MAEPMPLLLDPADILVPPDAPAWQALLATLADTRAEATLARWPAALIGTIPLGVDRIDSDVDIAVEAADLDGLARHVCAAWPAARLQGMTLRGQPCLVARLETAHRLLELFASPQPLAEQWGYRHFRLEARLLRQRGADLRARVLAARASGARTEPAFCTALGLEAADPYAALLALEPWTDAAIAAHPLA